MTSKAEWVRKFPNFGMAATLWRHMVIKSDNDPGLFICRPIFSSVWSYKSLIFNVTKTLLLNILVGDTVILLIIHILRTKLNQLHVEQRFPAPVECRRFFHKFMCTLWKQHNKFIKRWSVTEHHQPLIRWLIKLLPRRFCVIAPLAEGRHNSSGYLFFLYHLTVDFTL